MKTNETALITKTVFSDDGAKRYLLQKVWDSKLPKLSVIMLAPSTASGIELDSTNMLVLNNSAVLGFGSVDVLNLFSTVNDFSLKQAEVDDPENMDFILASAKEADTILFCPGVGKAKNKAFIQRQQQVLEALRAYEDKLYCLTNEKGDARLQHPLSPAVRHWTLSPLKVNELLPEPVMAEKAEKKKAKAKA